MKFETFLSEKIFELRNELNKLSLEYPELKPHFGLSHAGLLDTESEKLVESVGFFLTTTHASMQSNIANIVRNYMDPIFPELYMPQIPTCIVEFNNYLEFDDFNYSLKHNSYITNEISIHGETIKLSTFGNIALTPFKVTECRFIPSEFETNLYLKFNYEIDNIENNFNTKIRLYLYSSNYEEIINLIGYIFDKKFSNNKITVQTTERNFEIERECLSLNFNFSKNRNIFFESKNKLNYAMDILNNLKNFLYIDIDLSKYKNEILNGFSIKIPLESETYEIFSHLKNFIKTNCFVYYNIYKKDLNWQFINNESENIINIADLKNDCVLSIDEIQYINNKTEKEHDVSNIIETYKDIAFDFEIPFNIEHKVQIKPSKLTSELRLEKKAICTNFISNPLNLTNKRLYSTGSMSSCFGNILIIPDNHIFYNEVISDPKFFQNLYNINYYIGKKTKPLKLLIEYFEQIESLYYSNKINFYKYLKQINIIKWKFTVEMINFKPVFSSEYFIRSSNNKSFFFYDKFLEQYMTFISDKDYKIVLNRI